MPDRVLEQCVERQAEPLPVRLHGHLVELPNSPAPLGGRPPAADELADQVVEFDGLRVQERRVGIVIREFRQIADAVRLLLSDGRLEQFRENARGLNNRAVYEIPAMLERMMGG